MEDCPICQKQKQDSDKDAQASIVFENDCFVLRHSKETNIYGYLVLESKRHFLDLTEASPKEISQFSLLLQSAMRSIKAVTQPRRIYTFSFAEVVPHFHIHLVPATSYLPKAFRGRGIVNYPVSPPGDPKTINDTCQNLKLAFSRLNPEFSSNYSNR